MNKEKAEVSFYQLTTHPVEKVLPKVLEKVYGAGLRALIVTGSSEQAQTLDASLWTYSSGAFLPHGMKGRSASEPADNPIWITGEPLNENGASVLVLTDGRCMDDLSDYSRCVDIFDGNDPSSVTAAHQRRDSYLERGHSLTYWKQSLEGTWDQVPLS